MATPRQWIARTLITFAIVIPLVAIATYAVNPFGVQSYDPRQRILGYGIYRIPSASMLPTLRIGAIIISSAGYYRDHAPSRGDIVVFAPPVHPEQDWVKRIVGLPGDRIAYRNNRLSINGKPVQMTPIGAYVVPGEDPQLSPVEFIERFDGGTHSIVEFETPSFEDQGEGEWVVPLDHYFLMGDNRDRSDDSRYQGPVTRDALKGKVIGGF